MKRDLQKLELEIPRLHNDALFSGKRHVVMYGGRGSGKSVAAASKIIIEMCRSRKRVACFRQYQDNIRESSKELIERLIRDSGHAGLFKCTEREIVHRLNGGQIIFLGLERNLDKVRAIDDLDLAWVDEAQNANQESIDTLIPTLRKPGSQFIWTFNPTSPRDPIELTFRDAAHPRSDTALAFVNWNNNPWFHLTTMVGEMDQQRARDPKKAAHIWDGLHSQSLDAVVFRRVSEGRLHVPVHIRPVYGFDFGFTVSPLAIVQVYPLGDKLYVTREIVAHGISNERIPGFLDSILPDRGEMIIADSEDPRLIDYLNSQGFGVRAAKKGRHSVLAGIRHIDGFDVVVHPDCPVTLSEFRRLRWQTEKSGKVIENVNPIGDRHCLDAIRYACQDIFPGPAVTEDGDEDWWRGSDVQRIRLWPGRRYDNPFGYH